MIRSAPDAAVRKAQGAAVDSQQHATHFAEPFRAIKEKANNPQFPFSTDSTHRLHQIR
jgi:hypothetical protein